MSGKPSRPALNLDAAAAMPMLPGLPESYAEYLRQYEVNPHGVTCFAARCRQELEKAERRFLKAAGAQEGRYGLIWCSSATEAINIALRSRESAIRRNILCDAGGHPALRNTVAATADGDIISTGYTPDGNLHIPAEASRCTLAALTLVNSENGAIWNGDRSMLPSDCRILLDASQGFGAHPVPWTESRPDLVIFSAHKMGAAGNTALLLYRRDMKIQPIFSGGGQQNGIRPGTVHIPGCLLMADAAEKAAALGAATLTSHRTLNKILRDGIACLGNNKWPVFSPSNASPSILFFAIPGYEGALVARILAERHGILVGTGSACSAETRETSPLLRAMGVSDDIARCALRISMHHASTENDIQMLLQTLPQLLKEY